MTRGDSVGIRGSPFIHMCSCDMNGLPALVFQCFFFKVHIRYKRNPQWALRIRAVCAERSGGRGYSVQAASTMPRLGVIPSSVSSSSQERVLTWQFLMKSYIYGDLYKNRANISSNAEQSDASLTINQLTMDDNGTYECSVSLMADLEGTSKSRVWLLVLGECFCLLPGAAGRQGREGCRERWSPHGEGKPGAVMPHQEVRLLPSSPLPGQGAAAPFLREDYSELPTRGTQFPGQ